MDNNSWGPAPGGGGEPTMDAGDRRSQLQPDSRQRIVNMMVPPPHIQSKQQSQQSQSQITQVHPMHENQMNPQLQSMNLQVSSVATMQQNNVATLQHNSLSSLSGVPTTSQSMIGPLQSGSTIDSASLDSTAQRGNANSGDWQEEIYQKVQCDGCFAFSSHFGKFERIYFWHQPKHEQFEKLKIFTTMLERVLQFLQVPKSNILPNFKEKLPSYEKQIVNFLNLNWPRKPGLSLQQGQPIPPPHIQSMQRSQQSQSQITQVHPMHENQMNPHLQSMNLQGSSVATMQQNKVATLQHNSLSSLSGVPTTSQSMISTLQPGSTIDSVDLQVEALDQLSESAVCLFKLYTPICAGFNSRNSSELQIASDEYGYFSGSGFMSQLKKVCTRKAGICSITRDLGMNIDFEMLHLEVCVVKNLIFYCKDIESIAGSELLCQSVSSVATMQQNNVATLQHNSLSSLSGVPTTSQSMIGPLQSGSTIDSASLDSTAQRNANSGDWQEEIFKRYNVRVVLLSVRILENLREFIFGTSVKIAIDYDVLSIQFKFLPFVLHDSLSQQPKHEQFEKLKIFTTMLERVLQFLQVPKSNILPNFKEKLPSYEKQIVNFLNLNWPRKPGLSLQQGQPIPPPHIQSMQRSQQSQSQITQVHPMHENQMNPHLQSMNLQGSSVATMQQNKVATLQHNSLSSLSGVPTTSQSMISTLQPGSTIDSASLDSTAQKGNANSGDWQEEIYQKVPSYGFFAFVSHFGKSYCRAGCRKLWKEQKQPKHEQFEKLEIFKAMLERILQFLQVPKSNILPNFKEKLPAYEKQIVNFLNSNKPRKPGPSLQQGQQIPPPPKKRRLS
ncbi:hypothetical protein RHSIM_Rhsim01G0072100 [Rhododendron simsii]|uniref:Uncharacterized protein n=1 Tax=Rhododendron simsii TaxID=118357 RepID=A0A834HEI4_RHOSS|nr:hypothetical protein RHSIM_Rhsim01G0072100 [Rhododendron simsii]